MPDEFLPLDAFRFTPAQSHAIQRTLGGLTPDGLLHALEWEVYRERAIREGKGYFLPGGRVRVLPGEGAPPVNDAKQRRELLALRRAVERTSDDTMDWLVVGLTEMIRRENTRGEDNQRRLCKRCAPALHIPSTAIRDAIVDRLEFPLRGLAIEAGDDGPGIVGTATRAKDGQRVPVRLVVKRVLAHLPRGPSEAELRVRGAKRFVAEIARCIEQDGEVRPLNGRRGTVDAQKLRSLPALLGVLLRAAGYSKLSRRTMTMLAGIARAEAKRVRAFHKPRRRKRTEPPKKKAPTVRN